MLRFESGAYCCVNHLILWRILIYYFRMNERYGWDKYKSEGLAELEKIKSIMSLPKDKDIIDLVERYIRLYKHKKISKKDDTKAVMLYPDLVEDGARKEAAKLLERVAEQKDKDLPHLFEKKSVDKVMKGILKDAEKNKMLRKKIEEPARDKACREAQKLRQFLEGFYNSAEGKESACRIYFVSDERDYRLGIKKVETGVKKTIAEPNTWSGATFPSPQAIVPIRQPYFVIVLWRIGSPIEEDRWKYKHVCDEGMIYITLKNVGAEISWFEVSSPHAALVLECESKSMPTGATTILKLNAGKAWDVFTKGDKKLFIIKEMVPATLQFRYFTNDGLSGTQTYLYGPSYGGLELQS